MRNIEEEFVDETFEMNTTDHGITLFDYRMRLV